MNCNKIIDNCCNSVHKRGRGKRLLILGAGRGQVGLYKAAHEMGIHTIAGTPEGRTYPGMALADEICWMDIAKPDEALAAAEKLSLDGVATSCLETGIVSLGKICDALGLTGLTEAAAIKCHDKSLMKQSLVSHGVRTARYFRISSENDLMESLHELKLPVVVKATDLQGSNGVFVSRTPEEALTGFKEAMRLTKQPYCIVEEFIDGKKFCAEAFIHNGSILFIMPDGDITFTGHTVIPIGHYVPFEDEDYLDSQIKTTVTGAIEAIGLDNCAVNLDLIVSDGEVYVIELTGRAGANCLPELVGINYGINYYKMIVAMAVGDDPAFYFNKRRRERKAGLSKMIFVQDKSGTLESIEYDRPKDDSIFDVSFFKHPGDTVHKFVSTNDCIGQVIIQGNSLSECNEKLEKVISGITVNIR